MESKKEKLCEVSNLIHVFLAQIYLERFQHTTTATSSQSHQTHSTRAIAANMPELIASSHLSTWGSGM